MGNPMRRSEGSARSMSASDRGAASSGSKGDIELPSISLWVVVIIIAFFGVFAYAGYSYASTAVGTVSSPYLNQMQSVIGNGQAILMIPVSVKNILGSAMGEVDVLAASDSGQAVGCMTDNNGDCGVTFTPPLTSSASYATVSVNVGSITKFISVRVNPDPTNRLTVQSQNTKLPADGNATAILTVKAFDSLNSTVPDGTVVSFSLVSGGAGGSLSANSCETRGGSCRVTYNASIVPGNAVFQAGSYGAAGYLTIDLLPLPPSSVTLSSPTNSVDGDGKSTLTVTATVRNSLSKPVSYSRITFSADKGSIQGFCATNSSGSCQVIYSVPKTPGIAKLSASVAGSNVVGTMSITLLPVTSLQVSFNATPLVGEHIIPVLALNRKYIGENMTTITIFNNGSEEFTGTVQLGIPGWSDNASQGVRINVGETVTINLNPNLDSVALFNLNEQPVDYVLTVLNSSSQGVYQSTFATNITAFNTMHWFTPTYGSGYDSRNNIVIAWIQQNSTKIQSLLSYANTTNKSMPGYSTTYNTGCGATGKSACSQSQTTYLQLEEIYDQLKNYSLDYVSLPNGYFSGEPTVYTPDQSILVKGGNSMDGALVFASAAYAIGLLPYIALVPNDTLVCVPATESANSSVYCINTDTIGYGFAGSLTEARMENDRYTVDGQLTILNVSQILPRLNQLPQ